MAKYWEIRESYGDKLAKDKDAYECGYEEGYEAAMEEMKGSDGMGERSHYGDRIGERSRGYMGERRGRDSMGRYR